MVSRWIFIPSIHNSVKLSRHDTYFIAVLLYLIGFFTQAQEPSEQEDEQITETSTENNIENLKRDTNDAAYEVLYFLEEDFSIKTDFKTIR